ncbi:DUF2799 domain-containing protein [Brenneria izadpanahii]|uniref:DUF2799 domain-containing protein n=1 Tax=Brenneria izadpanahii TaxID=2722756 RepID=A0ABX7UP23_9GAMM|nr:DUF2799 domain-containing protein [Brenneria izadpanahii]QTF07401.1 DUF2799 domain-containing protein [Brenneria izadpanahii]
MKYSYFLAVILFLTGCQNNASAPTANEEKNFWYDAGYKDAVSGMVVKDDSALAEWFGTPQIDRESYLFGYSAGQSAFCQPGNMLEWGKAGKNFPASCDGVANAEQLRALWQQSIN